MSLETDTPKIHVIDYGIGNLGSIVNMCKRAGINAIRAQNPDEIQNAKKIILPGVGAFDGCVRALRGQGFWDVVNHKVSNDKIPVLGICVGFQMMTEGSDEGQESGLGWIKGRTLDMRKKKQSERQKFPYISWDYIAINPHAVLDRLPEDPRFYFVHSYAVNCERESDILAKADHHGLDIVASAGRDNIIGVQFHPEKSHRYGMALFKNFAKWEPVI